MIATRRLAVLALSLMQLLAVLPALAQDEAKPVSEPAAGGPAWLVAGSQRGLERWSLDGRATMISRGTARFPRWRSADKVVVLTGDELASGKILLQQVSLSSGKRRTLATLPPFSCKNKEERQDKEELLPALPLLLQTQDDFRLDRTGRKACLRIMDRNINMAEIGVDMEIDLRSGKTRRWSFAEEETCEPPPGVVIKNGPASDCGAMEPDAEPMSARTDYSFTFRDGRIVDATDQVIKRAAVLKGYANGPVSPSGRWVVLYGEIAEGDYMHRGILLFDRSDGSVHQVPMKATQVWSAAIDLSKTRKHLSVLDTVTEDDVRWLPIADADVLVVNFRVVVPGARLFMVRGEVAR